MQTVSDIMAQLGGVANVAELTGFPYTTIDGWKRSGFVPEWRRPALIKAAKTLKIKLTDADFPDRQPRAAESAQVAA